MGASVIDTTVDRLTTYITDDQQSIFTTHYDDDYLNYAIEKSFKSVRKWGSEVKMQNKAECMSITVDFYITRQKHDKIN